MVAPQQEDALGVLDFKRKEQADCLDSLPPPIDVVPQEEIGGLRGKPAILEKAQHVIILPVNIPADFDGGVDFDEHGLR